MSAERRMKLGVWEDWERGGGKWKMGKDFCLVFTCSFFVSNSYFDLRTSYFYSDVRYSLINRH